MATVNSDLYLGGGDVEVRLILATRCIITQSSGKFALQQM